MNATRRSRWMTWIGAALAAVLVALGVYLLVPHEGSQSDSVTAENGSAVRVPESGSSTDSDIPNPPNPADGTQAQILLEEPPSKQEVQDMDIKKLDGDLVAKSVGLSVGLSEMSEVDNTINPPGLDSAYLVRGHGSPGSSDQGTTYIALHSVQGAEIPGNKLIDVSRAKAALSKGDSIEVKGSSYSVTKAFTVNKDKLPDTSEVWEEKDGKLVILTCLQRPSGHSLQNVVIEAQLD